MKIDTSNGSRSNPARIRTMCTRCGSMNTVPIVYGFPGPESMDAFLDAESRREIRMGGSCVGEGMPTYHCNDCQQDSGHFEYHRNELR